MRFFKSVPFSSGTVIAVCAFAALGFSPLRAGLTTLPVAAADPAPASVAG